MQSYVLAIAYMLLYIMIFVPIMTYSTLEELRNAMQHTPSTTPLPFLDAMYSLQPSKQSGHSWKFSLHITYIYASLTQRIPVP